MRGDTFEFTHLPSSALSRVTITVARHFLSRVLRLSDVEALYRRLPAAPPNMFAALALEALRVEVDAAAGDLGHIPRTGALIVAANHPHGALDGLGLAALVGRVRPDVRLLANHWLAAVPELAATCFFVDPFGGPGSTERSRAGLRAAHMWLRGGGALIVFPAGEVAHRLTLDDTPQDSEWTPTVGRLAAATGAALLPAWIEGRNSAAFYRAGRLHPMLRTALLGRELLAKQRSILRIHIGNTVARPLGAPGSVDGSALTALARDAMDRLNARKRCADTTEAAAIAGEVDRLPRDRCLIESGHFSVFCASADRIPHTLREIGRLRELTYRAVGEGTGRDRDIDTFDARYLHLFLWDTSAQCVVGAYRVGRTDAIVESEGVDGLYTRTLYRYNRAFLQRLGTALELGRSFVRQEYQRSHLPLLLLWKGIGRFVSQHPEYRVLFGPVSISARYTNASKALLMAFLEHHHLARDLSALVEPRNPPKFRRTRDVFEATTAEMLEDINRRVAYLEPDGKGMPVLLRQYLKLNARLLGFSIDSQFGDTLDALMMVDLTMVDRATLDRCLGKDAAVHFLAHHQRARSAIAA